MTISSDLALAPSPRDGDLYDKIQIGAEVIVLENFISVPNSKYSIPPIYRGQMGIVKSWIEPDSSKPWPYSLEKETGEQLYRIGFFDIYDNDNDFFCDLLIKRKDLLELHFHFLLPILQDSESIKVNNIIPTNATDISNIQHIQHEKSEDLFLPGELVTVQDVCYIETTGASPKICVFPGQVGTIIANSSSIASSNQTQGMRSIASHTLVCEGDGEFVQVVFLSLSLIQLLAFTEEIKNSSTPSRGDGARATRVDLGRFRNEEIRITISIKRLIPIYCEQLEPTPFGRTQIESVIKENPDYYEVKIQELERNSSSPLNINVLSTFGVDFLSKNE